MTTTKQSPDIRPCINYETKGEITSLYQKVTKNYFEKKYTLYITQYTICFKAKTAQIELNLSYVTFQGKIYLGSPKTSRR